MFPGQVHGSHDGAPRKFVPVLALLLYGLWRVVVQPRGSCVAVHASGLRSRNLFTGIMRGGVHHIGRHEVQPLSQKSCPSQCLPSGPASLRQILGTGHAQNLYSIACSRHLKVAGHSETLLGLAKWKRRAGCIAFQPTPQLLDIQLQCCSFVGSLSRSHPFERQTQPFELSVSSTWALSRPAGGHVQQLCCPKHLELSRYKSSSRTRSVDASIVPGH